MRSDGSVEYLTLQLLLYFSLMVQDRLQRCTLQCQDEARDKIKDKMSSADEQKVRKNLETCLLKCGDKHVAMFPSLSKRLTDQVNKFL